MRNKALVTIVMCAVVVLGGAGACAIHGADDRRQQCRRIHELDEPEDQVFAGVARSHQKAICSGRATLVRVPNPVRGGVMLLSGPRESGRTALCCSMR